MFRRLMVVTLILALAGSGTSWAVQAKALNVADLTPAVQQQIAELIAEKNARTPTEQKVDSNLLYAFKQHTGRELTAPVAALQTGVTVDARQMTVVDITTQVTPDVLKRLEAIGAQVVSSYPQYRSIRANMPIDQVLTIAGWSEVIFVQPKQEAQLADARESRARVDNRSMDVLALISPQLRSTVRPDFSARAQRVQAQLRAALAASPISSGTQTSVQPAVTQGFTQTNPINRSEGDIAHQADRARQTYGYVGSGVKVCVLSDGVDSLASLQASGDLPAVTVVPGQAGSGDEGAAMLEIVHDLAPGAQLFFATAYPSISSFANNIKTLRNSYRCDIIVDDVLYFVESPFQLGQTASVASTTNGGIVTEAVNEVVANGALYFSAAGNSGNKDGGTSGVWEGDYADGGTSAAGIDWSSYGHVLDFDSGAGVQGYDAITSGSGLVTLFWSDPLGGSNNDYDLYLVSGITGSISGASTNVQNGTQDPLEIISGAAYAGDMIVVVKKASAASRYLQINTNRGQLQFSTPGQILGHSAAVNGFGVAAADAHNPAVVFSSSTVVENFSSDGPRRFFFQPDSTAVTPGNFSSTGGTVIQKPDLTAADGVSCAAPGPFDPFRGTSAAAPHAAAIAALLRSARPTLTIAQARALLTSAPGAIDIQSSGWDRDSGAGVLNALDAMQALHPVPVPLLVIENASVAEGVIRNGNGIVDPGEIFNMSVPLSNTTLATATNVLASVELLNGSVGARVLQAGPVSYGTLAPQSRKTNTATPFSVILSPDMACGTTLNFKNTVTYGGGGSNSPQVGFTSVSTGVPVEINTTLDVTAPLSFAGPPAYTATTGTQTGSLWASGIGTTCAAPTSDPGLYPADGSRQYDAYTFTNTLVSPTCVTVKLSTPQNGGNSALFAAAYNDGGFVPGNPGTNYLADAGTGPDTTRPVTFSFVVPAGQPFTIVVHEVNPGWGTGPGLGAYSLEVSGAGFALCHTVNSVSTYLPAVLK